MSVLPASERFPSRVEIVVPIEEPALRAGFDG